MADLDVAFRAAIEKRGMLRCVDVPQKMTKRIEGRRHVPVIVEVGGLEARTSLAPRDGGGYRLFLHSKLRKAAGVDTGEFIRLRVRIDPDAWNAEVPEDLAVALRQTPGASALFDGLTPGLRREFVRWVEAAKGPQTRQRRIEDSIAKLTERALERGRRRKQAASTRGRGTRRADPGVEPADWTGMLALYEAPVAELARKARTLILEVLPDLREEVDRAARFAGYSVGHRYADTVCTLHLSRKGVKIGIYDGVGLPDPRGLLEGEGKKHRHVLVTAPKDLRRAGLRPLLKAGRKAARERSGEG